MSSAKRRLFGYLNPPDNTSYGEESARPTVTDMRCTVGHCNYGISFCNHQTVRSHLVFGEAVLAELEKTHC